MNSYPVVDHIFTMLRSTSTQVNFSLDPLEINRAIGTFSHISFFKAFRPSCKKTPRG